MNKLIEKKIRVVQNFLNIVEGKDIVFDNKKCVIKIYDETTAVLTFEDNTNQELDLYNLDEKDLFEVQKKLAYYVLGFLKERYIEGIFSFESNACLFSVMNLIF